MTADQMPDDGSPLADPATPLGMMQRGRGAAFLWARERPAAEVADVLLDCVRGEPCWDPQVEDRTPLWIEVADLVRLDPSRLVEIVEDVDGDLHPDADSYVAAEILAGLAARGDGASLAALLDVVADGRNWADAAWQLIEWDLERGLEERLVARLEGDAQAREKLAGEWGYPAIWDLEPWIAWRERHPVMERIAAAAEKGVVAPEGPRHPHAGMSVEELLGSTDAAAAAEVLAGLDVPRGVLRAAVGDPDPLRAAIALRALGQLGDVSAMERAAAIVRGSGSRALSRAARDYIRESPGDTALAAARRWADGPDGALARLGWLVLGDRATADDAPRLLAALEPALAADDMYRLCAVLEGLANVPGLGPFRGVERAFCEAPYMVTRRRAAALLATTDPAFPAGLAVECLWDCDPAIRAIGARTVDRSVPGVVERLARMPRDRE